MFLKTCSTDNALGSNDIYNKVYTFVWVMNHLFMAFNKNQTLPHYCLVQEVCLTMNTGEVYYFPPSGGMWIVLDDLFRSVVLEL